MINWLIRILSLIICVALLAGGAYITYLETTENEKLASDWKEVESAEWIVTVENNSDAEQNPEENE